jgi:uncharacterized protein
MLVNFSVQNWMSFRDPTTFTMVASKEQQHGERLTRLQKYRMRLLPSAVLYGGNASGKTNFFKAINFAKQFVVRGAAPEAAIPIEPFGLSGDTKKDAVRFSFEILIQETIFELSFAVNHDKVIDERLVKITSTSEKVLYQRISGDDDPHLHSSIESQRLKFAFEGTRDNQLFLTNSVSQKLEVFRPVYDWFAVTLVMVAPDTRFDSFEQFIQTESPLYETMNAILPKLDTGICHLGGEDIPFDSIRLPEPLKQKIREDVREGKAVRIVTENDEKIIVSREEGELKAKKLYTYHLDSSGKQVPFEMRQESDGSKRIIDLLPSFLDLAQTLVPKVYIVDEIDRSLHSLLTQQLVEVFLSSCNSETRKQLLFTTHDLMLMNQKFFRRDEMWITERKQDGSSQLISFSEYEDIRNDKDILKSYLQGRMGGIPHVLTGQISGESEGSGAG